MRYLSVLLLSLAVFGCQAEVPPSQPESQPEPQAESTPTVQDAPTEPSPTPSAPPDAPAADVPERPGAIASAPSFEGVWSTRDDQGEAFDMVIFPNGQAVTNWSKGLGGAKGERGFWRKDGTRLIAIYEDGWTDVLEPADGGYVHKGFAPGTSLDAPPTNSAPAQRISGAAAGYAGVWRMNREPDGTYQYVALFSGGRAFSTVNGGSEGKWEITDKGARCTWPRDGWVDQIEHGPNGWQKRSWVGSESEMPADVSPVVRVGEEKFAITP
jgi:hypothetical protein